MGTTRSAFGRAQSENPVALVCRLGVVEGGPRESEGVSGAVNREALGAHASEHLVLDLDQIAAIEEVVLYEELVGDFVGMGVEAGAVLQGLALVVFGVEAAPGSN